MSEGRATRTTYSPALRVLAHPLRSRLVAHLRVHGPSTASELARALASNSGATSYHLRRLAEIGLIEDVEGGTGRRRVWRAVPDPLADAEPGLGEAEVLDEDERSVSRWLAWDYVEHFSQRARGWVGEREAWPAAWSVAGLEDHLVQVSAEQLTALRAELVEVLQRYRRVGQGNPQAKRVVVYTCALPVDPPPSQP
ncbi:MAG TPA: helix-turn-helix domain-containing protein [Ornithinimicrobium sp.]|uniref:ArsR/SmtB family transcription factor n=1 Tax=Ornithinimicrobium sp. TaxID=1977084 RepID=UPI002B48A248|nr:helix-turn-helix domain-containing protein [Ornithinimicrobium sp.]HKJ11102.1 helix-turn-helix domain-containing protein [Ornithinimicrobium sp.]